MAATFDPGTAPAVTFNARNAEAYERVMGQWSRRLAPLLIRFGGLADGDRVLDVGCGTGSLTFTLPQIANINAVAGIDQAEVYVAYHCFGSFLVSVGAVCVLPFRYEIRILLIFLKKCL